MRMCLLTQTRPTATPWTTWTQTDKQNNTQTNRQTTRQRHLFFPAFFLPPSALLLLLSPPSRPFLLVSFKSTHSSHMYSLLNRTSTTPNSHLQSPPHQSHSHTSPSPVSPFLRHFCERTATPYDASPMFSTRRKGRPARSPQGQDHRRILQSSH